MASVNDINSAMNEISLADEDSGGIALQDFPGEQEEETDFDWHLCVVGRFIAPGAIDFYAMQQTLASLWRPGKGVFVKELETNKYLFQFYHEIDIKRVVDGSPWYFNRKVLVISRMECKLNPRLIPLNTLDLWVQVHDLPIGSMSHRVLEAIGGYVGVFRESCSKNFQGTWHSFMRIRVSVDLNAPLKRRMKFRKGTEDWVWVNFKYENIPTFCFVCGLIGHAEKFCPRRFEVPEYDILQPYGEWMRAPFRRQPKPIGAQWLRSSPKQDEPPPSSSHMPQSAPGTSIGVLPTAVIRAPFTPTNMDTTIMAPNRGHNSQEDTTKDTGRSQQPHYSMTSLDELAGSNLPIQNKVDRIKFSLGFEGLFVVEAQGHKGGLAFLWRNIEEAQLINYSPSHIDLIISSRGSPQYRLTGIYGEANRSRRHLTWSLIESLVDLSPLPWCLVGDMNNTLSHQDKSGGQPYPQWLIDGFRNSLQVCGLFDLELHGYPFTWERGRSNGNLIEIRLDRALASSAWINLFPEAKLSNHEVTTSDHCPLFLTPIPASYVPRIRKFKFENAWLREPMCNKIIEDIWDAHPNSSIQNKLTICADALGQWGSEITGNFRSRLAGCKSIIRSLKPYHDHASTVKIQETSSKMFEILTQQEIFWKQRSKQLWLREGDNNSKFFHASARTRRRNNHIESLCNEAGVSVDWNSGLENLMVEYFQTLFKSSVDNWEEVINCISLSITQAQNDLMLRPIEADEVKSALFQMHPDKSPGPDGMTPGFYQKYWPIVGSDVVTLIQEFWLTESFDDKLAFTTIVLVPKKKRPLSMLDLRPISLCNVLYKILSKVLANRLKLVIDYIISEAQSAFIPGRLITDNIMISYEIMHYMKRKSKGKHGFMALKMDMSKAYDRVEWGYLRAVLCRMGFSSKLIALLMKCVTSTHYQIAHAGREFGHIVPERGLRQGDPLSSYLFIICTEGFSALLREYERRKLICGIKVARGAPVISHMFFADDSYIFCKATRDEAEHVLRLLTVFEGASGQKVNYEKSSVFFSRNTLTEIRDTICGDLGIHEADENSTYLGLPNILGRRKSVILSYLRDRILHRIHGWEGRFLSRAGKETLLKTVAQALPNYAMSVFLLPLQLSRDIERLMCKYWWRSSSNKAKIHWMSWDRMSKPKADGGLGFRSLHDFNVALLGKQGWRLLKYPNTLVSKVYKSRYYPTCNFLSANLGSSPSFIWRSIMEAHHLIKQGAAVRIGSGASVSIISDPWLPDKENSFIQTIHPALIDKKVSQLMVRGSNMWDMEILLDIFTERDINLISAIPINEHDRDDWYWKFDHKGFYTVKSAYALLQSEKHDSASSDNSGFWRLLWQLKVPPKVKNFLWLASRDCLPTRVLLRTKGVSVDPRCPFCNMASESATHLFVTCSFSQVCWRQLQIGFIPVARGTFADWLASVFDMYSGDKRHRTVMLCWALWKCRNDLVWNHKGIEAAEVVVLSQTVLNQWSCAQDKTFDLSLGFVSLQDGCEQWSPPTENKIKVNCDAALFASPQSFSFSCIARDFRGQMLEAIVKNVRGSVSPEVAEALGIKEALSWIKTNRWNNVEVESDCLIAVQAIRSSSILYSYFGRLITDCRNLLLELKSQFVSIKFVKRSANTVAHYLARTTCIASDRHLFASHIPSELQTVLLNDLKC
ncbi:uncharacterized protein LOC133779929 [Humulus lupulus]|uniref:uncharacterized protein LOC133779929 n=1 Tax=Humulus lupulus TaxID=3486 RepID=UPI002B417E6E|nr:uncharacterized protein LOC133779929 [Humulus lupulus]